MLTALKTIRFATMHVWRGGQGCTRRSALALALPAGVKSVTLGPVLAADSPAVHHVSEMDKHMGHTELVELAGWQPPQVKKLLGTLPSIGTSPHTSHAHRIG